MAHHIYQTEGLVLGSSTEGESSKYLKIFTRELGLIGGTARSVRQEKSKLRYGLADYSRSTIGLVRGKDVWRIVNAVPVSNYYDSFRLERAKLEASVRVLSLVRKLVAGEGAHADLYDTLVELLDFLEGEKFSREETVSFQLIAALRILERLGYGAESGTLSRFASGRGLTRDELRDFAPHAAEARSAIRTALSATHL